MKTKLTYIEHIISLIFDIEMSIINMETLNSCFPNSGNFQIRNQRIENCKTRVSKLQSKLS